MKEAGLTKRRKGESPFLDKNATPADAAATVEEVLESVRPLSVVEERRSAQLADVDAQLETALGETAKLTVRAETKLEPQFNSEYQTRSFPWALKYRAGGADFPNFARPSDEESVRWRRGREAAILTPLRNAKNLARRVEIQVANDWNLVPAARNIAARHTALQSSYASCTMNAPKSKPLPATATELVEAAEQLYKKLPQGSVQFH